MKSRNIAINKTKRSVILIKEKYVIIAFIALITDLLILNCAKRSIFLVIPMSSMPYHLQNDNLFRSEY